MKSAINSTVVSSNRLLVRRIAFAIVISIVAISVSLIHKQPSQAASGENPPPAGGTLKIVVRDSMTGVALSGDVVSEVKNGVGTLWTNARGQGDYLLSSGRNELEVHAANHQSLRTHFEPDSQAVKNITFWVDPLAPAD